MTPFGVRLTLSRKGPVHEKRERAEREKKMTDVAALKSLRIKIRRAKRTHQEEVPVFLKNKAKD